MFAALGALKFLKSKPFIMGLAGLAVVTILFMGHRHYTGLVNEVSNLRTTQALMQNGLDIERAAVVELHRVIGDWETARADLLVTISQMQEETHEARTETRRLQNLFAEIDLESLAAADLDSLANYTTDRLWQLIQSATDPGGRDSTSTAGPDSLAAAAGAD